MSCCSQCARETKPEYRYCPWCAAPQRRKLVELFMSADPSVGRGLRVSRYLPERLVRFSVWDETGTVRAAVSLDDDEAARLAEFVATSAPRPRLFDELRALVRR